MRKALKFIAVMSVSCGLGLLVGGLIVVLFNDISWAEYFRRLQSIDLLPTIGFVVLMIVCLAVAGILQIIIHEAGHLVAGLLTGYRFVSFRVFSLTLIRKDGRFQFRRFGLSGTGGQCLMAPPQRPLEQINSRWYNLGGVLANVLTATVALLLFFMFKLPMWLDVFLSAMVIIGFFYALTNGISMKVGGVGNDGYNLLHLEKSPQNKRLLCQMLQANACIQEGLQPKELPTDYFDSEEPIDWSDGLQANWQMMVVARLENLHEWEKAYDLLSEAMNEADKMLKLFWLELAGEMAYVCLITGRTDKAGEYYTPELQKYVNDYLRTQSSKQRILFTKKLIMDGDRSGAEQMLGDLYKHQDDYLMQGELAMDLELMEWELQSY